eukprot:CAMPEP_0174717134 /NCGR_PEP_ID=MMETSP1094-20130205/25961_1 /TAXON_ID=156173 /ORGANISM="Chrysochromulina brevifilum, Strain UTEX LB 985" /LENGTH=35 /DNA_ID= /DNA_START= /DNA_END= /DNA_ORIENTATION=
MEEKREEEGVLETGQASSLSQATVLSPVAAASRAT